jgi:uncharacterized protein (TIGR02001 family)
MKTSILNALALCAIASSPAIGQQVQGNVSLATDYIFRGVTQTDNGPAISGGFDIEGDGFYAGVWGSSVDFSDDTTMELDLYGGFTTSAGGFDLDLGGIYYAYPDSPSAGGDQNFVELYGGVSRQLGLVAWDAKLSWSPDFYLESGSAWYLETGGGIEVAGGIVVDARIGVSRFEDMPAADYEDYQIGISGAVFESVGWDLRYHDVSGGGDDALVFSISQSFGG